MRIAGVHGRGGSRGPDIASALDDLGGQGVLVCDDRTRTQNRRCHILLHSGGQIAGAQEQGGRGLAGAGHSRVAAGGWSEQAARAQPTGVQALSPDIPVGFLEGHSPGSNGRAPRHWG
jgi:hypothetical protein